VLGGTDGGASVATPKRSCETAWEELECRIQVPRKWLHFFEMKGMTPTATNERRRFPRFHYHARGVLHYRQTLPVVPRPRGRYLVLTKDVCRDGVCFLHEEQLFPHERMPLDLPGGRRVEIEVFRCTKHNSRCFEIGARVTLESGSGEIAPG